MINTDAAAEWARECMCPDCDERMSSEAREVLKAAAAAGRKVGYLFFDEEIVPVELPGAIVRKAMEEIPEPKKAAV